MQTEEDEVARHGCPLEIISLVDVPNDQTVLTYANERDDRGDTNNRSAKHIGVQTDTKRTM